MTPRIAFIGNFKHPTCTETYLARAFRENGCVVTEFQQETIQQTGAATFVELLLTGGLAHPRYDLVLYTRTHNASALGGAWSDAWAKLGAAGIPTASFHLDRFWDLEREHLIHDADPLFTVGTVFTADGGNDDRWAKAGINHVWLPPAVDRQEAEYVGHPTPGNDVPPIIFTGSDYSQTNHRDYYPPRGELLRHLNRTYGPRGFGHYGHGGNRPVVRGVALNDVLSTATVIVGDSCFANDAFGPGRKDRYWSDRIPETIGRSMGGIFLHPQVPGLDEAYGGGIVHYYFASQWDSLDEEIERCLAVPAEERRAIVAERRAAILAAHTYTHRASSMLDRLGIVRPEQESVTSGA